jgi:hypothetical protein
MKKGKYILNKRAILLIFIAMAVLFTRQAYSFTDQITTERILRENKHFIDFIDVTITNFGDQKLDEFQKIYDKHFNAEVAFLQADYHRAYKRIYSSQGDMVRLYKDVLKNFYLEDSKNILDKLAPDIIRSKDAKAKHYLTLGYRDRTVGWTHYTVGDATNPKQHSQKLYKYEEAIKMTRRAKKYGFLAMFQSQPSAMKIKIYTKLLETEKGKGNLFFGRFLKLDEKKYIDELNNTFREFDKKRKETPDDAKFENLVQRRVRFKKEARMARYLLNQEFDKAEFEMRQYVEDYNFKLIDSTLAVLAKEKKESRLTTGRISYDDMRIHLLDNYSRLKKESALSGMIEKVRVEDDINGSEGEKEAADKKGPAANGKVDADKKENLSKEIEKKDKKESEE